MNLLGELFRSAWYIDEAFAVQSMPLIQQLLSAGKLSEAFATTYGRPYKMVFDNPDGSTATIGVIPINSVITKYDNCGFMGLTELDALLQDWGSDTTISGVLLKMDTPGGSAGYLPNIAQTIRNYNKPIATHFSGLLASAGYYIGSQTSYIASSTATDMAGSIGTMLSFEAPNPDKKDPSTVVHTVYATKSTEKNQEFNQAMKGQYDLIRQNILDPFNEQFHKDVQAGRPGMDKKALSGATYMSEEALKMGLIDAVMSWNDFSAFFATNLTNSDMAWNKNRPSTSATNKNQINMKNTKLSAILGKEATDPSALTAGDLQKVEAALAVDPVNGGGQPAAPAATTLTEDSVKNLILSATTAAVTEGLKPIQTALTGIETRLNVVEDKPGATATPIPAADGGGEAPKPWNDPENPLNKAASEALGLNK